MSAAEKSEPSESPFSLVNPESEKSYRLFDGFKVGRVDGDLVLNDDTSVSSKHCVFKLAGNQLQIEDLGSRNGTFVNGRKIEANKPILLHAGDKVEIGNATFRLHGPATEGTTELDRNENKGPEVQLASLMSQLESCVPNKAKPREGSVRIGEWKKPEALKPMPKAKK